METASARTCLLYARARSLSVFAFLRVCLGLLCGHTVCFFMGRHHPYRLSVAMRGQLQDQFLCFSMDRRFVEFHNIREPLDLVFLGRIITSAGLRHTLLVSSRHHRFFFFLLLLLRAGQCVNLTCTDCRGNGRCVYCHRQGQASPVCVQNE